MVSARSRAGKASAKAPSPRRPRAERGPVTLAIDVGGTGLKALLLDARGAPITERVRIATPRPATPAKVVGALVRLVRGLGPFDRVSVGFPGVVVEGVVRTAPNLDGRWRMFPLAATLEERLGKPTRALNDAGVQGYGIIEGRGTEMVLTLGTGMGTALFVDGRYLPNLELAHHPFRGHHTYEDYVGGRALERLGKKKWSRRVGEVIAQIEPIWNPDHLYLGGGNAKHLRLDLPPNVSIADNVSGLLGGIALWRK